MQATFKAFEADLAEHFKEEEDVMMPLLRCHVSPAECKKHIVNPIVRSMSADANGAFFDAMDGEVDRKEFMKQEGIPFFIVWLLNWHLRKYTRNVKVPFEAAVAEAEAVVAPAIAA
jgi:hypothetical protein